MSASPTQPLQQAHVSPALAALEARVAADLAYVEAPAAPWVQPRHVDGQRVLDVVVVGAGLSGLGTAHGLLREQVRNIAVIDQAAEGHEGPWLDYARMPTLRTAKTLIGPDLGLPSLSFPAWYQACFGHAAWEALQLAPVTVFVDYLRWFRRVAAIPVHNRVRLLSVQPHPQGLALHLDVAGAPQTWHARKLVLATGLASGGAVVPGLVSQTVPASHWAHASDAIDFTALQGRRVAVLGAGASAFDNAGTALEHGAAAVHLYARRQQIEQPAIRGPLETVGLYRHYPELADAQRWRIMRRLANYSTPPPPYSVERCTRHTAFSLHTGCPWQSLAWQDEQIHITTAQGVEVVDFVILATGFSIDIHRRRELHAISADIACWRDRYTPPADDRPDLVAALAASPYLGPAFQYTAVPGRQAPWLADIHDFGLAGLLSMGRISQGIPGMRFGPHRLVEGISRDLFLADAQWHEANLVRAEAEAVQSPPLVADPASVV